MNIDKNNITAVILAGGKGRRLEGQDKGLVFYKNKPLVEHVIERIQPQVTSIIINANRNLSSYEEYRFPVISDDMNDFQGPLAGFITAMKVVKTDYIITLPCDAPLLPHDLVSRLLSKLETANTIAVAHDGKRKQSIHALIPVSLMDSLESYLNNGDRKVALWYEQHQLKWVDFSDQADAFFNINTQIELN